MFDELDDDGDDILTKDEIKTGLEKNGIKLSDSEWDQLVKVMDSNADGVLTIEEWEECLQPKLLKKITL